MCVSRGQRGIQPTDVQTFEDQIARENALQCSCHMASRPAVCPDSLIFSRPRDPRSRLEEHLAPSGEGFQRLPDDSGHSSPAFYK